MKTKLLLLLPALLLSGAVFAQTEPIKEIKINFKDRNAPTLPKNIKRGEFYRIVIEGLNPNLYSVVVNSKDTIISTPLEMPTFADISSLSGLAAVASAAGPKAMHNAADKAVIKTINDHIGYANSYKDRLITLADEYETLKLEVYSYQIDQLSTTATTDRYDGVAGMKKFLDLRKKVSDLRNEIKDESDTYAAFLQEDNTKKFLTANADYAPKTEAITKKYEQLLAKTDEVLTALSADNIQKFIKSVLYLNGKGNQFVSLPIQFSEEQTRVELKFAPRDTTIGVQEEKMTFRFPLHSNQYWSVGTSFYYSNLRQSRYSVQTTTVDEVSTYTVSEQEELDRELGIAVILRGGLNIHSDWVGAHLAVGPGLSIGENAQPRLLFGGGFSFGRKHCLTLDFGGIAGYVDKQANGFATGVTYDAAPAPLTVKKLQIANFFAIGYMFKL